MSSWPSSPIKKGGLKGGFRLLSEDVAAESPLQVPVESRGKAARAAAASPVTPSNKNANPIQAALSQQFGSGGSSAAVAVDPLDEITTSVQRVLSGGVEFIRGKCQENGLLRAIRPHCTDVSTVKVTHAYRLEKRAGMLAGGVAVARPLHGMCFFRQF